MPLRRLFHEKHQFRAALFGHKAVEAGAVCLVLMVQGNLVDLTLAHLAIASKTGLLAVSPALVVTFTQHARFFTNKWVSSGFLGICTFLADAALHGSHYPGAYTEAAMTGLGACVLSMVIAYTPIGRHLDTLAEVFLHPRNPG